MSDAYFVFILKNPWNVKKNCYIVNRSTKFFMALSTYLDYTRIAIKLTMSQNIYNIKPLYRRLSI